MTKMSHGFPSKLSNATGVRVMATAASRRSTAAVFA